jgi:hypothetical protein
MNKPCKKCGKMSSDKHYTCIHDWIGIELEGKWSND